MKLRNVFRLNKQSIKYQFIHKTIETEEISVLGIIKYLLSFWKGVVVFGFVFLIIGIIQANNYSEFYVSKSVIIPGGGAPPSPKAALSLDAFMAPPVASTTSSLGIESFAGIMESRPFLLNLLDEPILSEGHGGYLPISDYLQRIQPKTSVIGTAVSKIKNLPNRFFDLFVREENTTSNMDSSSVKIPTDTLRTLTMEQIGLMVELKGRVKIEGVNPVTIETEMPTAKLSTRLNNLVLEKLVEQTIEIRTGKQQRDLMLAKKQLDTAKTNFIESQLALAKFQDQNNGGRTSMANTTLENLSTNYSLYSGIYSDLASKVEMMKIDLLENTPFYNVFEPAYVPLTPIGSFNSSSVIRYVIFGIVFGILWAMAYTGLVIFGILRKKLNEITLDKE
ncbi:hypothetical protein [Roseivirga echinicomitans]|uniref:Polysaccharide chain length determinant N-terminal domain-containing protein n=1 Tax=Roseivirga echinicomitans TaxID=296218 RepID=A0A150XR03_9BACT|nr:hypothetical protein [Roseivirga echinicomitans]KYG81143.1 hypothetical protein AWN68_16535 [Roseivirga echinicomitans]